ncbi:hypothetical protein MIR68_001600 [Amoeboaphelidium protococcarum]|nr:hypothetical protein MIR68_001600 [Amoeboaphelidium protococcarum]KAI3646781.1 hypothetical protein MP228_009709 [Amoeboaphelidium protococcarum]
MMLKLTRLIYSVILFFGIAVAANGGLNIRVEIADNLDQSILQDAYISLNGQQAGSIAPDGRVLMKKQVPSGIYTLRVESIRLRFPMLKVVVGEDGGAIKYYALNPSVYYQVPQGYDIPALTTPIVLKPLGPPVDYVLPRQSFNVLSILSNPMVLMLVISGGLMFLTPKLMENMDQEQVKEVRESQSAMQGLLSGQTGLSDFMAQLNKDNVDQQDKRK